MRKTNIKSWGARWGVYLIALGVSVSIAPKTLAQEPATILEIQIQNAVLYSDDATSPSQLGSSPNIVPPTARVFLRWIYIGDIVSVNGTPAKGVAVGRGTTMHLTTSISPGQAVQAIADTSRNDTLDFRFEIQQVDGTPIGTIMAIGLSGGVPPPGAPSRAAIGNNAIAGGTGAFLGARGQMATVSTSHRLGSMIEDPANRRINGGGPALFVLHVIPMSRPEIAITASGPAVVHSNDFSLVSPSKPATAGEILSLLATGLGPTRISLDPGEPFPSSPLAVVNSPVEVTVNGKSAELLGAVGYPGGVDGYQVNFRMPSDTAKGSAAIQITAAWIAGMIVNIPVQ